MNDTSDIAGRLAAEFENRRVILWEDTDNEYIEQVDSLSLSGVTVLKVARNEFGIKTRVLVLEPTTKFLIYRPGEKPKGGEDWLLDLELAHGTFRSDRMSMILDELGLDRGVFASFVIDYADFFRNKKRLEALKSRLAIEDDPQRVRAKMSAVLAGAKTGHRLSDLSRALLQENAVRKSAFFDQLCEYGLDGFLWEGMERIYGYPSKSPSIDDFVIWIFDRALGGFSSTTPGRFEQLEVDFRALQVDRTFEKPYATLSGRAADALGVRERFEDTAYTELLDNFVFEEVDSRILRALIDGVVSRSITQREVEHAVRARLGVVRGSRFESYFRAVAAASALLSDVDAFSASLSTFDEGIAKYSTEWFEIDQRYRHFIYHSKMVQNPEQLADLRDRVESAYVNDYLHAQGLCWQQQVDAVSEWKSDTVDSASSFFEKRLRPIVRTGQRKAVVIISDALRYEVADELKARIRQEDRFEAELTHMLGMLPSFTQLGMAALLPHETLELSGDGSKARADGQATDGAINRRKLLAKVSGQVVKADDLLSLSAQDARTLVSSHQILYVYHNRIDAIGDNAATESQVFDAVEKTLTELVEIVKKLANSNARTNVFITADHGFQYQDAGLEDAGYLSETPHGDFYIKRRYVIGRDLPESGGLKKFTSAQLGLQGDFDVQIPKSTHRIRRAGEGTRFVHGGATLQEIVVPLLLVNKSEKSDTRKVEVKLLPDTDKITTGQLVVRVSQQEAVGDKVQSRTLRAGLYVGETLISSEVERTFDQGTQDTLARISTITIALSTDANDHEGGQVELRLMEREGTTNYWKKYVSTGYMLKRSFIADF